MVHYRTGPGGYVAAIKASQLGQKVDPTGSTLTWKDGADDIVLTFVVH
jgi:hypothetical protein